VGCQESEEFVGFCFRWHGFCIKFLKNEILLKIQACFVIDSIGVGGSFVSYETYRFRVGTAAGLGVWD
jgi:hypothetical protein